jgi:adenylate cyclase
MADVFVSYSRRDKARVAPLVAAMESRGWSVWWDPEIAPGQEFDRLIDAELAVADVVLVVWSASAVDSRWVRGEAREAAERGTLVPVRFDGAILPLDVRAFHTIDLDDADDATTRPVQELLRAIDARIARRRTAAPDATSLHATTPAATAPDAAPSKAREEDPTASAIGPARIEICVLPFVNMSGEPEQDYFSDGITEDIITDLSKVSALSVVSRNTAFKYKGRQVDVPEVARELEASHVLEGSVRKAGGRVRITAQLVEGAGNDYIWAERYDRDLNDIFAIQDEISEAIVTALKLKLLPEEKRAIERRGTDNVEAYNLYLMARQLYVSGHEGDARRAEAIVRLCVRATEIDPAYAHAWALLAIGKMNLRFALGRGGDDDGLAAAERALALDPDLAEAHATKARILADRGSHEEASAEIDIALRLDPECYEVNRSAAYLSYREDGLDEAIRCWEKAAKLMETDINSPAMLLSCYRAVGNAEGRLRAARLVLARSEKVLAQDPNNGTVTGYSAYALAALGEAGRAKEWMNRALLIDPDNWNMRYNFACVLLIHLHETDAALDLLEPVLANVALGFLNHAKADPDFVVLRDNPRFQAMIAAAEARLA